MNIQQCRVDFQTTAGAPRGMHCLCDLGTALFPNIHTDRIRQRKLVSSSVLRCKARFRVLVRSGRQIIFEIATKDADLFFVLYLILL